jgi:3-oxoacyl-[acyl-carrier protein] reductase
MIDMSGKVAVVTGATQGIGLATVKSLAAAGATVVLSGRDGQTAMDAADAVNVDGSRGRVVGAELDVSDADASWELLNRVHAKHERLDVVVANAGICEDALLGMIDQDRIERTISVNIRGTLYTIQAASRVMRRSRGGSIVALSSIVGERGNAGQTLYAASKAAISSMVRSAAKELGSAQIRVNAVAPGLIKSAMTAHLTEETVLERIRCTPLGRWGTVDDVADAVRFLASDDARFITGQVLGVDGGMII